MPLNREALIRYGQIKAEVKKLETEMEMLQPVVLKEILEALPDPGENYVSLPELEAVGKFTWYPLKKWLYSDHVKSAEKALKERKAEEQALGPENGGATYTETPVLKFVTPKDAIES